MLSARPSGTSLSNIVQVNNNGNIVMQNDGKGITVKSPDGLTTKTIGIDNAGNILLT
jgi:hypothetical protein